MVEFNCEEYLQQVASSETIEDCPKVPIPSIGKNQNYLFVSYSHKDYKAVYSDLAHLYCHDVRFWYDKGLHAGKDWEVEVCEHIKSPNCCGVIFYLSTNMFLSDSIIKEIEFTQTKKKSNAVIQKNYFCVNLHGGNISDILFDAQQYNRKKGFKLLSTDVQSRLTSVFSDKATHLKYTSKSHVDDLLGQIREQFDVIGGCPNQSNSKKALTKIMLTIATAVAILVGLFLWQPWRGQTFNDTTPPTLVISNIEGVIDGKVQAGQSISFTVTSMDNTGVQTIMLSENMIILPPGLSAQIQVSGEGNVRTVTLNEINGANGDYTITIAANAAQDVAGNQSAEIQTSFTIDSTIPTLVMTKPVIDSGCISFKIYADDETALGSFFIQHSDVTTIGFVADTIEIKGTGSVREIKLSGITITSDEDCRISIAAGVAADHNGNQSKSIASSPFSFDISKPALTISAPSKENVTAGESVSYTIATADNVQVTYFGIHKDDIKMVGFTADIEIVEKDDFVRQIVFSNVQSTSTEIKYFVIAGGVAKDALGNGNYSKNSPTFEIK